MKLLFDENLSARLCRQLNSLFPGSSQVSLLGLERATDRAIWDYAKANRYVVVTLDADFVEMAALFGPPPKIIRLRCGNQPTAIVEELLRVYAEVIADFEHDEHGSLELY
jgi:predicted nuclease of predicted toxin-antitoxin system